MLDEEELARELAWVPPHNDRRFFKTRPAGVNVMNAIAALLALLLMGLVGGIFASQLVGPGVGRTIGALVAFGAAFLLSIWLSRRIWCALPSSLRVMLRPIGFLGPVPAIAVLGLGAVLVLGVFQVGTQLEEERAAAPFEGIDFAAELDPQGRLVLRTLPEAQASCAIRGDGWRLPRRGDEALLHDRLVRPGFKRTLFFAEPESGEHDTATFRFDSTTKAYRRTLAVNVDRAGVVCLRPSHLK